MEIEKYGGDGYVANCYLVIDKTDDSAVIIDPSVSYESVFRQRGNAMPKIEYILLTHAHFDHMLALEQWRQVTRAPLALTTEDAQAFGDPEKTLFGQFLSLDIRPAAPERTLEDGDIVAFGHSSLKVMKTPGHTCGSCCYIGEHEIFTGDTLFSLSVGRTDFYGGSSKALQTSLSKLRRLRQNYVLYPGHGAKTTLDYEKKNNRYF